jgi:hypothetical protein
MKRGRVVGLLVLGLAVGLWLALGDREPTLGDGGDAIEPGTSQRVPAEAASPSPPPTPAAPDFRIEEGERLQLNSGSLPQSGELTISLALGDEARGMEPRKVVLASARDGRRLELTTAHEEGSGSGVRVKIDSSWLEPGAYMLEVRTAEKIALPLRRYVIEVR